MGWRLKFTEIKKYIPDELMDSAEDQLNKAALNGEISLEKYNKELVRIRVRKAKGLPEKTGYETLIESSKLKYLKIKKGCLNVFMIFILIGLVLEFMGGMPGFIGE